MFDGKPTAKAKELSGRIAAEIGRQTESPPPAVEKDGSWIDHWIVVGYECCVEERPGSRLRVEIRHGWPRPRGIRDFCRDRREWDDDAVHLAACECIRIKKWREDRDAAETKRDESHRRFRAMLESIEKDIPEDMTPHVHFDGVLLHVYCTSPDEIRAVCAAREIVRLAQKSEKPLAGNWLREFFSMASDVLRDLQPEKGA